MAATKEVSTARKTSRWYCQGVAFTPVCPPGTVLLLPTFVIIDPNQGVSLKHKASQANDAKGPGRSPADRPELATSRRKPLIYGDKEIGGWNAW